ncbi:MAG: hypothetical protein ACPGUD_11730 [Parashewanella sp.]
MTLFELSPKVALHKLPLVKAIFFLGLFITLYSTGDIVINSELHLNHSFEGYNGFFDVFKFPLQVSVGSIGIIAVIGAFHRSSQIKEQIEKTEKQIEITTKQNNVTNYYKHREDLEKYIKYSFADEEERNTYLKDIGVIHSIFYPSVINGDLEPNTAAYDTLIKVLRGISAEIYARNQNNFTHDEMNSFLEEINDKLRDFCSRFHIITSRNDVSLQQRRASGFTIESDIIEFIRVVNQIYYAVTTLSHLNKQFHNVFSNWLVTIEHRDRRFVDKKLRQSDFPSQYSDILNNFYTLRYAAQSLCNTDSGSVISY